MMKIVCSDGILSRWSNFSLWWFDYSSHLSLVDIRSSNQANQLCLCMMKIYNCDENQKFDKNSTKWWKFSKVMKIHHCVENKSLWWISIIVMKIPHCNEILSLGWKLITFKCDELSLKWWTLTKVMEIHWYDKNPSMR